MSIPPFTAEKFSLFVALAFFFVKECSSFHVPARRSSSFRFEATNGASLPFEEPITADIGVSEGRRQFLSSVASAVAAVPLLVPIQASASTDVVASSPIKVTPIAHTFVANGSMVKPIRENDATRFFTNARVVYIFDASGTPNQNLVQEITDLTIKRKAEKGPGVTPGNVQTLASAAQSKSLIKTVSETAKTMSDGDVLLVGPIASGGTAADGKLLTETADALGTFVGGRREKGVISVLLNGPKENLKLVESGYPASELLWYSLPSRN